MDLTHVYVGDIAKSERDANGDLYVYGKATGTDLDLDGQRCDPAWLKQAMPEWYRWANIREQHGSIAAGVGVELTEDGTDWWLKSLVVDKGTAEKVEKGVLKGYSIGIKGANVMKTVDTPNGWIKGGRVVEVSLVDHPCNQTCDISIAKAVGATATDGGVLAPVTEDGESVLKDGDSMTVKNGVITIIPVNKPSPIKLDMKKLQLPENAKVTDVDRLDAPAPDQKCDDCGEDGHLACKVVNLTDREKAISLVKSTIANPDETADISGAQSAIKTIATLIQSEASDLAELPYQTTDIQLLLDAVSSLYIFISREQAEQAGTESDTSQPQAVMPIWLSAKPDLIKGSKYDSGQMASMLKSGQAMPNAKGDPSYPIADADDLSNAIKAVGRGKGDHDAIRRHIIKRAKALGKADMIPDSWTTDSAKALGIDESKLSAFLEVAKSLGYETDLGEDGKLKFTLPEPSDDETDADKAAKKGTDDTSEGDDAANEDGGHDPSNCDASDCKQCAAAAKNKSADSGADDNKTSEIDKAATSTEASAAQPDLVKMFTTELSDETSTLATVFKSMFGETVKGLAERLEKIEAMPTGGGPALRRTEADTKKSRTSDLLQLAAIEEAKGKSAEDADLRRGYLDKAARLRIEASSLHA